MLNKHDWNFENFRVVISSNIKKTTAIMRVTPKKLLFNLVAAAELDYPAYVQILVSNDATKLVVIPHNEKDRTSVEFYHQVLSKKTNSYVEPKHISICEPSLTKAIHEQLEWKDSAIRFCTALRFEDMPQALFFDLRTAKISARGGQSYDSSPISFADYPPMKTIFPNLSPVVFALPSPHS